jgi:hypothetical protein
MRCGRRRSRVAEGKLEGRRGLGIRIGGKDVDHDHAV